MTKVGKALPRAAAVLAAALLMAGSAMASMPDRRPAGRGPDDEGGGPPPEVREARQAMQRMMIARMKQDLDLTPAQEQRVMPQFESLIEARREFAEKRRVAMSHLRAVMIDETVDEREIEKALRDVRELDERFQERQRGLRDAINGGLLPRQQARLVFFEERFRNMMQRRLREAGSPPDRRPRGAGPGRGGGPGRRGGPGRGEGMGHPPDPGSDEPPDAWDREP